MEHKIIFGGSYVEPRVTGYQNFRGVRPHDRAAICITREKITPSFSYILIYEHMAHNVKTKFIIGYSEGPSIIRQYQSTYIQYGSNMFRIFLGCINDEVSADAAADAAYVTTTKQ